jgi:hypothetical protein
MEILKFICLVVAIMYGFSNIAKLVRGDSISSFQLLFMSVGIVGFIYL